MLKDEQNAVLYIRLEAELAEALRLHCFRVGLKKNPFVIGMLRRELGLDEEEGQEPDPDPAVPKGVPEVAPQEAGKELTGGDRSSPLCLQPVVATTKPGQPDRLEPAPEERFSLSGDDPGARTKSGRLKRKYSYPLPDDFEKTPGLIEYAVGKGVIDPEHQLEKFRNHHESKGNVYLSWLCAWRTWVLNAIERQEQQNIRSIRSAQLAVVRESEKQRVAGQIFASKTRGIISFSNDQHSVISGANIVPSVSRRLPG